MCSAVAVVCCLCLPFSAWFSCVLLSGCVFPCLCDFPAYVCTLFCDVLGVSLFVLTFMSLCVCVVFVCSVLLYVFWLVLLSVRFVLLCVCAVLCLLSVCLISVACLSLSVYGSDVLCVWLVVRASLCVMCVPCLAF